MPCGEHCEPWSTLENEEGQPGLFAVGHPSPFVCDDDQTPFVHVITSLHDQRGSLPYSHWIASDAHALPASGSADGQPDAGGLPSDWGEPSDGEDPSAPASLVATVPPQATITRATERILVGCTE
jgi:hypothetical protein